MKTNKLFFLLIFSVICTENALSQVVWPLSPQNQQHPVVGSVGEYRDVNRFHKGTDVSGTGNVYAINSGTVTSITSLGTTYPTVWVGNIAYVHVNPSISINSPVIAGQTILGTVYNNHVHLESHDMSFLSHSLSPYVDAINPVINYVEFRHNGASLTNQSVLFDGNHTINNVDYTVLFNKVDMIVDARDPSDNSSRMAPIALTYHLFNNAMSPIDNWVTNFDFRTTPSNNNTTSCFYSGTLQAGVFKYILTSHPNSTAKDRYLNTCLNKNNAPQSTWPTGSTLDAQCNSEGYYPDGIYNISFAVFDADYDNYTNNNNSASVIKKVLIDNFCPYVSRVKIYEGSSSTPKYNRGWLWASNALLFEPQTESVKFDQNQDVKVEVITSEPMKEVKLQVGNYIAPTQTCGTNLNKTTWTFILPKASLNLGPITLNINGTDLADNQIQKNPAVIPIKQPDGTWVPSGTPAPYSPDTFHQFIFGKSLVDFTTEQLGQYYLTVKFTDKSSVNGISLYSWNFGNGSSTVSSNPESNFSYTNMGVYSVTHSILAGLYQYSITKPVSVNSLTAPIIKNIFFTPKNNPGKSIITYKVDFFSDCDGIISTYTWRFIDNATGNVVNTNYEKNPVDIALEGKKLYTAELTVGNYANPSVSYSQSVYIDPDTYPFATIQDWEVTYFVHDLEVSTDNFKENEPLQFIIEYGDGITETYIANTSSYHTFTHNYYELGEYVVKVTVTGKDAQGMDKVVRTAKKIRVQPYDLDVNISYRLPNTLLNNPPQPKENISFNATVAKAASGSNLYGSWGIYRVGDPNSYHAQNFSAVTQVPAFNYTPDLAGEYKVMLDVNVSDFATSGSAGKKIVVENAPKYMEASISSDSYLISLNSNYTLYGAVWPTGQPNVSEENWNPTNIRWTLTDPQGIKTYKNETFPYDQYDFTHYFTQNFNKAGTYTLLIETWNKNYQYEENGELDPSNNCRLSYYNYVIKQIVVSADLPSLKIDSPIPTYYQPLASVQTLQIKISNPSVTKINWVADYAVGCGPTDWFHIQNTTGSNLCCNSQQTITVNIDANPKVDNRFGCLRIHGYLNGIEVQGSPAWVQIDQYGTAGPSTSIVYGEFPDLNFGYAVSIDGKTAIIGSPNSSYTKGQAYIYQKSSIGGWDKKSTLLSSDNNPEFGNYVDISGDYACVLGNNKVYFFRKGNPDWAGVVTELKYYAVNTPKSVTLWGDYAAVGSPSFDGNKGKVTIYYRNQGGTDNWGLVNEIIGNTNDFLGNSLDIYNNILVVGAPQLGSNNGYIKIYNRNMTTIDDWGLEQTISGEYPSQYCSGDNMKFGQKVSVFEDAISVPYYCIYNSIYGAEPEMWFQIFRKGTDSWGKLDKVDYLIPNNADGGNKVNSTSIYKFFNADPAIETKYLYNSYSGFPTLGNLNSGDVAFSRFLRDYHNFTYSRSTWMALGADFQDPNTMHGNSIGLSYNSKIIGAPGKINNNGVKMGAAIIANEANKDNLYDAEIDLSLINFTKPIGSYSDVIARNITLGGRAFPAVIENGANIKYVAKEIILQDGFLADHGSTFTVEPMDNSTGNPHSPQKKSNGNINPEEWPLSVETERSLIKTYMSVYPDLPWQTFNIGSDVNFEKTKATESTQKARNTVGNNSEASEKEQNRDILALPVILLRDSKIKLNIKNRPSIK